MNDYSFLKSLQDKPSKIVEDNTPKIQYQEFYVNIAKTECRVLIPLRESDNFENELSSIEISSKLDLIKILRKYRGIRG